MKPLRLLPLLATVALLAGCGGSSSSNGIADKTPDEIITEMFEAIGNATSVHIQGATPGTPSDFEIDLQLVADQGGEGTLTIQGVSFDVMRIGDTAYFKGGPEFWSSFNVPPATVNLLKDRWISVSATTGDFASLTPFTDLDGFFSQVMNLKEGGTIEKGEETDVDGEPALALTNSQLGGTLFVATTGEPYPLKVEMSAENQSGEITFSEWDEPHELTAPADAVDLSSLAQ